MAANVSSPWNALKMSRAKRAGDPEMTQQTKPVSVGKIEITKRPHVGLYPGTFDPVTLGHLDIIKRAVKLVDHLVIGVATNAPKDPFFSLGERLEMVKYEAEKLAAGRATIAVVAFNSLLVQFAAEMGASVIIRGLRAVSDFEYEFQMVAMNQRL